VTNLAVDPSNPRPGTYIVVNLLRGSSSAGAQGLRALIVSPPQTGIGDATLDTEVRPVFSAEDVQQAQGRSLGYLAWKAMFANDKQCLVDLITCTESAGAAAAQTLTFAGAPTSNMTFRFSVMGTAIDLSWNVGEAATLAKTNAVTKINQYVASLFCLASAGSTGVVNLTANSKGPAGNDVKLRIKVTAGAGGTATLGGATLVGGTTEPDMTTALSNAPVKEYDFIVLCTSNADAIASSSSNPLRAKTMINANNTGSASKLDQLIVASSGTIAQAKVGGLALNEPVAEHFCSVNDESLPCELAAAEAGDRMRRRRTESNANRVLQPLKGLKGSADPNGDQPTDPEATDALNNGVSLAGYAADGTVIILRSVTTHSQDTSGNPDRRCFDTNEVDGLYDYTKDLRTAVPQQFQSPDGQVKIAKNRQPGDDPLPVGVVEERDVRAFIIQRTLNIWVPKGVIDGAAFQAAADDGTLTSAVNASDSTQLDVFIPASCYKIAAKFGIYVAKVA
jgi:phage tail sheath gpL-like